MQIPDRGIVYGIIILICALIFQRGLNYLGFKSSKAETFIQGEESVLIEDGVSRVKDMNRAKISRQQLYASLRNANIYNLGEVERAYLEACGLISIFKFKEPKPGLPLFPAPDKEIQPQTKPAEYCFLFAKVVAKRLKNRMPIRIALIVIITNGLKLYIHEIIRNTHRRPKKDIFGRVSSYSVNTTH